MTKPTITILREEYDALRAEQKRRQEVEAERDSLLLEVDRLKGNLTGIIKDLRAERDALKGLEEGTHYRCTGCDVIYPFPCASTVGIYQDHVARFCAECTKDSD